MGKRGNRYAFTAVRPVIINNINIFKKSCCMNLFSD